ncbi:hypothetical protein [Tessaracoccus antarcticus]|uniref:Cobalamin adenosyltransferase-like domain-containing protein n=1 Tax=Tessaracoccus antarcticus TaxID=2479848 RepID=A0A3M0G440_9ACTN|nr:hypothetical protein [Tessaracoccus antarcticus]RMB59605.1 hypothetical protein EAX62_07425 [Tessaracoccus antarcticus]
MVVTEVDLRDQLRRPALGDTIIVPAGARLSPAARDFVNQWQLVMVEQDHRGETPQQVVWDKPAAFPVTSTDDPCCSACGGHVAEKPSALTQLNAHHYAPKTHPRIILRGQIDSLHALILLVQGLARDAGAEETRSSLGTLAAYCRELMSAEYNERPCAALELGGISESDMHHATHDPLGALGIQHLAIDDTEPMLQHWLNVARTQARQLEITALQTFESPHHPYGASICHGLNRLSSAVYYVALRLAASA